MIQINGPEENIVKTESATLDDTACYLGLREEATRQYGTATTSRMLENPNRELKAERAARVCSTLLDRPGRAAFQGEREAPDGARRVRCPVRNAETHSEVSRQLHPTMWMGGLRSAATLPSSLTPSLARPSKPADESSFRMIGCESSTRAWSIPDCIPLRLTGELSFGNLCSNISRESGTVEYKLLTA